MHQTLWYLLTHKYFIFYKGPNKDMLRKRREDKARTEFHRAITLSPGQILGEDGTWGILKCVKSIGRSQKEKKKKQEQWQKDKEKGYFKVTQRSLALLPSHLLQVGEPECLTAARHGTRGMWFWGTYTLVSRMSNERSSKGVQTLQNLGGKMEAVLSVLKLPRETMVDGEKWT